MNKRKRRFGGLAILAFVVVAAVGGEAYFNVQNPYLYCVNGSNGSVCLEASTVLLNTSTVFTYDYPYGGRIFWDDLRTSALSANVLGTNGADLVPFMTRFYTLHFDHAQAEYAYMSFQMPHAWKEGTDVELHIHWSPETNASGGVVWCAYYAAAKPYELFTTGEHNCTTVTVGGNISQHLITQLATVNMSNRTLSTILHVTLLRNATNASDSYASGAYLHQIDVHYQTDAPGSKAEYIK